MKIECIGRNVQVDNRLRSFVEQKVKKITRLLGEPVEARVTLEVEKHRHLAEIHVTHRLGVLQAADATDRSLRDAVNLAMDKLSEQARRSRQKRVDRKRRAGRDASLRWPVEILEGTSVGAGARPRIIESSHLPIKPMTIDEAALELEGSEHGFVVFLDAASERVSVLYKRKDQNYGLIAPGV